ncbi:DUF1446 domain-containing protein [Aliishimia ponticola]|uniref:DUF1446 domain-containing protein n=1 Tax=Aliishimia ponticola TaxID=2499833 RepID=A0A4V3XKR6_9RHOB|nr:acyclic terpene utilization AtuA family protein [Aliishimia ponticola]THH38013.1 DUF1446 domain-containing protein [Aliishimia ponticola]
MTGESIRIGGASGFWGDAPEATAQLLRDPDLGFLVYDYLAEITLSIMARARQKDASSGYATDFIHAAMAPNLAEIAARGVRVLSNAGGMNPEACAAALRDEITRQGLNLRVAVVAGDDLSDQVGSAEGSGLGGDEMFSGAPFPAPGKVLSVNAYLGAGPIVAALDAGADILITGRCVDSALILAAGVHSFGWAMDRFDLLAAGSLAGHLIECGPQATGGNFTDWADIPNRAQIGYPIAELHSDGRIILCKPRGTGGRVTRETVGEQMLYEIADPRAYALPDVICDFSEVTLTEIAPDQVEITGASGRAPSGWLKTSTTWFDGYRAGQVLNFNGQDARAKGRAYVEAVLQRVRAKLAARGVQDFDKVSVETFGGRPGDSAYEEVSVTAAVQHQDAAAVGMFLKDLIGGALATPPGLHFFTGAGRPKPSPVVALHSSLVPVNVPKISVTLDGARVDYSPAETAAPSDLPPAPGPETVDPHAQEMTTLPLEALAVARSGDKGDAANIGVMARVPAYLPWIWAALTPEAVAATFGQELEGSVDRYYLPGSHAMNIVLHQVLGGGGVSSLRNDSQGKGFAQRLLHVPIPLPAHLVPNTERKGV